MSSKRRIRRKSCEGKRRHKTHEDAMKELRGCSVKTGLRIYKCQFCHHYHVGHMSARARAGMEASRRRK